MSWSWALVFLAMLVSDFLYARYTMNITSKHIISASSYAAGIQLCMAFTVVEYTKDAWLVIPAALGAALGTWIAIKRSQSS